MDFRIVLILMIGLPLGLVFIVLASQAWQAQRQSNAAHDWARTSGTVVSSEVAETAIPVRRNVSLTSYRMTTRYASNIVYEYTVGGSRYQSATVHLGPAIISSDDSAAKRQAARYPIGSPVLVYYNPSDPKEATLNPQAGAGTIILWLIAFLILVISVTVIAVILGSPPITMK
jgi:hypothetical protein